MYSTIYVAKSKALISCRTADLRLCFRICKNPVFSWRGSFFKILANLCSSVDTLHSNQEEKGFLAVSLNLCYDSYFCLFSRLFQKEKLWLLRRLPCHQTSRRSALP